MAANGQLPDRPRALFHGRRHWGSVVKVEEFQPPAGAFLEARIDDGVCGCVGLRRCSGDEAEVKRLYVADQVRGRGVGEYLLAAAAGQALALGFRSIVLDTDGSSAAALALFRSQGFVAISNYNRNTLARYWFRGSLT